MSGLCSFRCAGQQLNKSELKEAHRGRKWHHVLVGEVKPGRQSDPFNILHQVIQLLYIIQVTLT